jgi:hypothetical protein
MTDKDVERVAEAVLTDDAATRASLRFLRQRFVQSKCDSEAVADCVRCNVMFLVRRFEDALSAAPAAIAAYEAAVEPTAYLKFWFGEDGTPRCRVDMTDVCEPWLDALQPTITPLYPRSRRCCSALL